MVIVMNMDTGKYIAGEFGAFEEEVMNAQWLPQPLTPQLGMQQVAPEQQARHEESIDVEAFLRTVYLSQE